MRLALRLQRVERKGHVAIFIVHNGTDNATWQVQRLVAEFFPRLIELLGDVGGRRAVAQDHRGERQARSCKGLAPVIPAELLHPLLQPFGGQLFHFLCGSTRPSRNDGHLLDRERGVFRPAQHQERHHASDGERHEQEQRDGPLAYGESGEIEAAHRGLAPLTATLDTASLPMSRTCSPSCSRCAPSATMRSPASSSPTTEAASSL